MNSGGTFIQAFRIPWKTDAFCHGASELPAAIFKERGTPDVGQGKGLLTEGIYRYFPCNDYYLVLTVF